MRLIGTVDSCLQCQYKECEECWHGNPLMFLVAMIHGSFGPEEAGHT